MADPNTRQGKRTPVTLKIKFKSETLEQFIERYAVDVSQGGIFIRTKEPLAVGTQMKFEFQLRDASPLIAGEGTVVWTRENDPSRPAIAPGMGVRFDKLADGSQAVLEKILAEKAKQAPSRTQGETAPGNKPASAFTDVPTRVAPAPVQEALGLRSRQDSEQTPLPRPMPFHGDHDDFDEKAFDEATKVRSLDDLAAESAKHGDDGGEEDDGSGLSDNPKNATVLMPADELAVRRRVTAEREVPAEALQEIKAIEQVRRNGQIPVPEGQRTTKSGPVAMPDRDSAPTLPSPPSVDPAPRAPRVSDAPANRPASASEPAMLAKGDDESGAAPPARANRDSAAPRAIAPEPSRPSAPGRSSIVPIVLGIILVLGAAGGAVWYFVLRDKGQSAATPKADTTNPIPPNPGSAAVHDKGSDAMAKPDNGSAGSAAAKPDTGSATPATGSGSATNMAGSAAPAAPTVDTVITAATAKGAIVEIVGTDQKGPAPFTAKLEKDKTYKAHVTAPFFSPIDLEVKGGANATAKLVPDPHTLSVSSDPPGAEIYIDNVDTQKLTPADVTLTAAQAAKPRIHVTLRRSGFRPIDQVVESTTFKDDGTKATASISAKLQQQQQVVRPPNNGSGTGGTTAGSGTSGGSGGTDGGGGGESGSAATPPPPPPPPPPPAGSGSSSGGQVLK